MKVDDLDERDLLRVEFSKSRCAAVPKQSGIYVISTYFNSILYIGVSRNLQRRMFEHLNQKTKLELTPHGKAYWFFYKTCLENDLNPGERGWIHQYQLREGALPYFNKIEAPI